MSENPKNLSSEELIIRNTYLNAVRSKISKRKQNQKVIVNKKGKTKIRFDEKRNIVIEPNA